jgi:ribosomal protein L31
MKLQTHPKITKTLIQMKDGSTYTKRWLFFRNVLSLEVDYLAHTFWRKRRNKINKKN